MFSIFNSGIVKSVAQLDPTTAANLVEWLQDAKIPCESKTTTDEAGLDVTDVLVDDAEFDRACDVAEKWEAALKEEREKHSKRQCDQCGSKNLETIPHDKLDFVLRCKDCGNLMPLG